jgi:hypothetical protein
MSVGRPPGLFVRCATEARRGWHLCLGSLEDRCDLIERELGRNVSVVWATISEDATRSRGTALSTLISIKLSFDKAMASLSYAEEVNI